MRTSKRVSVSLSNNKTEQKRWGQKAMCVLMDVDHVSGRELVQEEWEDVDEVDFISRSSSIGLW